MLYQYNILSKNLKKKGLRQLSIQKKVVEKIANFGKPRENLRKDIGTYSDRLMLNAKTYNAEIEQPKKEVSICEALRRANIIHGFN